jgi:hypothetical protein
VLDGAMNLRSPEGTQRKRLELARGLAMSPRFILMDEVTGGVDQRSIAGLIALVLELSDGRCSRAADHFASIIGSGTGVAIIPRACTEQETTFRLLKTRPITFLYKRLETRGLGPIVHRGWMANFGKHLAAARTRLP